MRFALSLGLALMLTPVARAAGLAVGLVDRPGAGTLKIHDRPVPLVGGPAAILAAAAALALTGALPAAGIVIGAALALVVGLVDDASPLPPWPRLGAQTAAGVAVAVGVGDLPIVGVCAVVLITVASANAVNIMDGQDGLAGGLAAIAALGLVGTSASWRADDGAVLGAALAGGMAGFVVWNMSPARIFMGNGGAYAVGTLLAALAGLAIAADGVRGALAAGSCLGLFVFEIVFTVARRARAGGGATQGDRLHSYDLLADRGHPRRRITFWFWVLGASTAGLGLLIAALPLAVGFAVVVAASGAASVAGLRLWTRRPSNIGGG